eukprot:5099790-Heterocapsa_arctica.AAC.1
MMRKYHMLVNKKQEQQEEEAKLEEMRTKLKNDRTQRCISWVEHSWGHKKKYIYKWIRGKT